MNARSALAFLTSLVLILACSREAKSAGNRTVVLELFTSQGCSSCPPADKLLSKLGRESFDGGRVIPLAYHVDYWNHLGWRDPFSSAQWSARQNEYARAIKSAQVYTPQVVVGGRAQMVGSAEAHVRGEIERQLERQERGFIAIDRVTRNGDSLQIDVRARVDAGRANVMIALFENAITTSVASGENARRELTNDFIVRWESRVKEIGTAEEKATITIPLSKDWNAGNLGVAAFLQDPKSLAIQAADARM
jgi:hypothetical protein